MNTSNDITEAARRAEAAFQDWRRRPPRERRTHVRRLRWAIVEAQERIARAVAEDTGKPVTEVLSQEITGTLELVRFIERRYPCWLRPRRFRYWRPGFWRKCSAVHFEPIGVLAVIGPGNFPFSLVVMQAAAALMCGNTVVIKPSERCPKTATVIREVFQAGRFPDGVATVVEGGPETAEALIAHEAVRKVLFTGSYAVGRRVAEQCGRSFKPCVLELGGSGAAIVCEDADLDLAARGIAWSALYANGQSCIGTRRVFVLAAVHDAFVARLNREIERLRQGDPLDPNTDITEKGVGSRFQEKRLPTPFSVESVEEAVEAVNASEYGLSASIWGGPASRVRDIARILDVGMVWINDVSVAQPQFPWGGVKHSGWGRLFAREALTELTVTKVVSHEHRPSARPKLWWFPYGKAKHDAFLAVNRFAFGRRRLRRLWGLVAALRRLRKANGRR